MRRWLYGGTLVVIGAVFGTYAAVRFIGRAPEHATLASFVADLKRARAEAGESPQRYAYRLYHYSQEALKGKDWAVVKSALKAQGAVVKQQVAGSVMVEFPTCAYALPYGRPMIPRIMVLFEMKVPGTAPTQFPIDWTSESLVWKADEPLANLKAGSFPKNTILSEVFARNELPQAAGRFPILHEVQLHYQIRGTPLGAMGAVPATDGDLSVRFELRPLEHDQSATVIYTAPSQLEPKPERIFKWLPLTVVRGHDQYGPIECEKPDLDSAGAEHNDFLYLASSRNDEENEKEDLEITVYSDADIRIQPAATQALTLEPEKRAVDYSLLAAFPNLRTLRISGDRVNDADLAKITKLQNLRELELPTVSSKGLHILAAMPLTRLNITLETVTLENVRTLAGMKSLTRLELTTGRGPHDQVLGELAKLRTLRELNIPHSGFTLQGLRTLTSQADLTSLSISLAGLPAEASDCLASQRNLDTLFLEDATLSEEAVRRYGRLAKMREFILTKVKGFDAKTLPLLQGMRELDVIQLSSCPGATAKGLIALKHLLPGKYRGP